MSDETPKPIPTIAEAEFDSVVSTGTVPVLVDFSTEWCGPCLDLARILEQIARDYAGKVRIVRIETDREKAPNLIQRYKIRGVPTIIVFRDGQPVARWVGLTTREAIIRLIGLAV